MSGEKLYTDRDYFDGKFKSIDDNFKEIKDHLEKLNGSVSSHEKIINENLPHDISHCIQVPVIKKLEDNMITAKAVKKFLGWAIGIIVGLITIIWGISEIWFK